MRINHNISAQLANVSIKKSESKISLSLERLSSGYKITKAADDSAGMAISNKMRTQIRALDQSSRNAEDGQSIIQTADGALSEVHSLLQRVRELSVQAANDTYTIDDRNSAQAEMNQLMDEVDRIAKTTEFNGKGLLDGSASRTIKSSVDVVSAISTSKSVPDGEYNFEIEENAKSAIVPAGELTYQIPSSGTSFVIINCERIEIEPTDTDDSVLQKITSICDKMNITVEGNGSGDISLRTNTAGSKQNISIRCAGQENDTVYSGSDAVLSLGDTLSTATYIADGNYITISDINGFEMQVELPTAQSEDDTRADVAGREVALNVYNAGYMTIQIGANEHQNLDIDFPEISCQTLGLKDSNGTNRVNVCTSNGATNAIDTLDAAIEKVSAARANLGAYENRIESTISSLNIASENMTDSMSRIMDTNMATEMTRYTQLDVLKQASSSMLSQANNRPQQIMSLLQGM